MLPAAGSGLSQGNQTKCVKPARPRPVVQRKACVDGGHRRGSARKGGLALQLCCVPSHMLTVCLCTKNVLPLMPHGALNCELGCLAVSLVWCVCQGAFSGFAERDGHGASSSQGKRLVFEKRAVCPRRFEMQVPKGSLYWRHVSPSRSLGPELRQHVLCPRSRQRWAAG